MLVHFEAPHSIVLLTTMVSPPPGTYQLLSQAAADRSRCLTLSEGLTAPDFCYTDDIMYGADVPVPTLSPNQVCSCLGDCSRNANCACRDRQVYFGGNTDLDGFLFTRWGSMRTVVGDDGISLVEYTGIPIASCNSLCTCASHCQNKVCPSVIWIKCTDVFTGTSLCRLY